MPPDDAAVRAWSNYCRKGRSSRSSLYKIAISLAVPSATLWSNITHVISYWYTSLPARHQLFRLSIWYRSQSSPTPPMPFLPVTLPSSPSSPGSPSSRALGPAHRSRIGPRRVLPRFHDLFIKVSVSPMLPRFSLRLTRFRARDAPFRRQSKGNAPHFVMMK